MQNNTKEIAVGGILVVLLLALINPGGFLMPTMTQMIILTATVVAFAIFVSLVWGERVRDEREQLHRFVADRAAFWSTAVVLMLAIVVQGEMGMIDSWLPIILGAMVLGKIAGLIYSKNKL